MSKPKSLLDTPDDAGPLILDACCGGKLMYHGLEQNIPKGRFVSIDVRRGDFWYRNAFNSKHDRVTRVRPDVIADMQHLPFRNSIFHLIIFDPPHAKFSKTSYFAKRYGSMDDVNFSNLSVNDEFTRVLRRSGLILAKIYSKRRAQLLTILGGFVPFLDIWHKSKSYKSCGVVHWILFCQVGGVSLN